jgi:ubiquinone/menaquinone biosynthesis C-methylase UbiE
VRPHDWSGFVALGAIVWSLVELVRGDVGSALGWGAVGVGTGIHTRYRSVNRRRPKPHLQPRTLHEPPGNKSAAHVERILEVGPGIGIHSVPVARLLAPGGTLDVFDMQQAMLDDVMRRAQAAGITNLVPRQGDARRLPYADRTFDAAYLIGVLGEIPDELTALRELRRVLKPGGRLVVGEVCFDPDYVRFAALRTLAADAAFALERRAGNPLSYLARFVRLEMP